MDSSQKENVVSKLFAEISDEQFFFIDKMMRMRFPNRSNIRAFRCESVIKYIVGGTHFGAYKFKSDMMWTMASKMAMEEFKAKTFDKDGNETKDALWIKVNKT